MRNMRFRSHSVSPRRAGVAAAALLAALAAAVGAQAASTGAQRAAASCPSNLTIGVFGPFTGSSAVYMPATWNSEELVVNAHNKAHPDCKIALAKFDTQGDPAQNPALARQAIQNSGIVVVAGPFFSGEVQAAEPLFEAAGMPTVISDATIPQLAQHGWKVFHRVVVNDAVEGGAEANYIAHVLHAKKVAAVDNGQAYGKGNATIVRQTLGKLGVKIVDSESIDPTKSDFSSTVDRIRAVNPQVIYCGCLYAEAGRLLKQLRASGVKAPFMGDAGVYDPGFVKLAGTEAANGAIIGSGGTDPEHTPGGRAFLAKWKAAYHSVPQLYGAENYDAATAIVRAIEAGNYTRSSINDYLSKKTNFKGATGIVQFGPNGDIRHKTVNFYKIVNGKITYSSTTNG